MINKEHLLTIPELNLAGKLATPSQFTTYTEVLNSFIDDFPKQADKLRDAVDDGSYSALAQQFNIVCNLLGRIFAERLANEYRGKFENLMRAADKDDDAIEALIENFILAVSSLSIDIQMASKRNFAAAPPKEPAPARPAVPPRPNPNLPPQQRSATPVTQSPRRGNLPLLLAVDNAVMFLNTLKRLLEHEPYDIHCVESGDAALDYLRTARPDAFLLDVEMPGMDGYELARRIKHSGQTAPIIFITANSAREYVDKAAEAGAVGMLMKPVRAQQLLAKLRDFVK
jgi:CheY-like chemotaxis protein